MRGRPRPDTLNPTSPSSHGGSRGSTPASGDGGKARSPKLDLAGHALKPGTPPAQRASSVPTGGRRSTPPAASTPERPESRGASRASRGASSSSLGASTPLSPGSNAPYFTTRLRRPNTAPEPGLGTRTRPRLTWKELEDKKLRAAQLLDHYDLLNVSSHTLTDGVAKEQEDQWRILNTRGSPTKRFQATLDKSLSNLDGQLCQCRDTMDGNGTLPKRLRELSRGVANIELQWGGAESMAASQKHSKAAVSEPPSLLSISVASGSVANLGRSDATAHFGASLDASTTSIMSPAAGLRSYSQMSLVSFSGVGDAREPPLMACGGMVPYTPPPGALRHGRKGQH